MICFEIFVHASLSHHVGFRAANSIFIQIRNLHGHQKKKNRICFPHLNTFRCVSNTVCFRRCRSAAGGDIFEHRSLKGRFPSVRGTRFIFAQNTAGFIARYNATPTNVVKRTFFAVLGRFRRLQAFPRLSIDRVRRSTVTLNPT